MKRIVLAVLCVFFACDLGIAADSGSQETTPLAMKVDDLFAKWNTTVTPACAVAVIQDGKVVYKRGYGMADLDHDIPIRTDSVFHIASTSKQFTAAAIVLLAQEGRLSFDDPIRKYLPQLPDFGHEITIRHLIHHTSGLRDQWDLLELSGWRYSHDLVTDKDVMDLLIRQKELNFPPGSKMAYSNSNYTLLGQIVKKVTHQSLREFTTARLFEPLGMQDTHFRDDFQEVVKNQAIGYEWDAKKGVYRVSVTNFDTVGATSLLTTVDDLARWDRNFYEPTVGGEDFGTQMYHSGMLNNGEQLNYAFGLQLGNYRGLKTVRHAGGDGGYRSELMRFPDHRFSVVVLSNSTEISAYSFAPKIADIYLEQHFTTTERKIPDATVFNLSDLELARYEGLYWCDEEQNAIRMTPDQGQLVMYQGEWKVVWQPSESNLFINEETSSTASFELKDREHSSILTINWAWKSAPTTYQRQVPYDPTSRKLQDFVGLYRSEEIDPTYRITLEGENLILHRLKFDPDRLEPIFQDTFRGKLMSGSLRFDRDQKGDVTGFKLNTFGLSDFRFVKQKP